MREVSRLTGWRDKVFARRYQAIPISEEEAAQVARLVYVLSNGCKEDLVARSSLGAALPERRVCQVARRSPAVGSCKGTSCAGPAAILGCQ